MLILGRLRSSILYTSNLEGNDRRIGGGMKSIACYVLRYGPKDPKSACSSKDMVSLLGVTAQARVIAFDLY